ncbi:MAG TPA: hypothetical protein VN207_13620 [Ktedonobacteraceae bacterium]|nr:hypothetical protein [Ktedonobacteraceae bacterium]
MIPIQTLFANIVATATQEIRERGELWRPYRTFATWYMWAIRRLALKKESIRDRKYLR